MKITRALALLFLLPTLAFGAEVTDDTLKGYFEGGDVPTQAQFEDLIDSKVNKPELASESAAEGADLVGRLQVANLVALKALEFPTTARSIYLLGRTTAGDGGEGVLVADLSDLSTEVTADTLSGVYVPPDSASTGASGAWVRQDIDELKVLWFATNTTEGTTDMTAAIQLSLELANTWAIGSVYLRAGTYLTGNIDWPANEIDLHGANSGYAYGPWGIPKTFLKAKAGTTIVLDLVQTGAVGDRTGNRIYDLGIDGDGIAAVGINGIAHNIYERVQVEGCTTAGILLSNLTNSTRIVRCNLMNNTGWGLRVDGAATTIYTVTDSIIYNNTLGGVDIQGGVLVNFQNCVIESNPGPGVNIYRPNTNTGTFQDITFDNCWIEDNGQVSPYYSIVVDAFNTGSVYAPSKILFKRCRVSAAVVTRKYLNAQVAKWLTFEECVISGSTASDALTLASTASYVAFIESAEENTISGITGLTATQLDNAIAQGTYCYSSDKNIKRIVGAGAPAAAFENSWENFGAGWSPAQYWFARDGLVHVEGAIKTGTPPSVAFTLPAGYRPSTARTFSVDANGAYGQVHIAADGTVTVQVGSATKTTLDGIVFPVQ